MAEELKRIVDIEFGDFSSIREAKKYIDDLKASLLGMDSTSEAYAKRVKEIEEAQGKLNEVMKDSKGSYKAQKDSIIGMQEAYKELYKEYIKLSEAERNSPLGQKMQSDLRNLSDTLNEAKVAAGNYKDNIGRYAASFEQAFQATLDKIGQVNPALASTAGQVKALVPLIKAVSKQATAGLQGTKAALASTGIGALIIGLGLLITNWEDFIKLIHKTSAAEIELKRQQDLLIKSQEAANKQISETIAKYNILQNEWKKLKTSAEQKRWIEENKSGFDKIGLSIENATDAQKAFVTNSSKVISAIQAQAEAMALQSLYTEEFANAYKKQKDIQKEYEQKRAQSSFGTTDGNVTGVLKAAGYTLDELDYVWGGGQSGAGYLSPRDRSKLDAYWNKLEEADKAKAREFANQLLTDLGNAQDKADELWIKAGRKASISSSTSSNGIDRDKLYDKALDYYLSLENAAKSAIEKENELYEDNLILLKANNLSTENEEKRHQQALAKIKQSESRKASEAELAELERQANINLFDAEHGVISDEQAKADAIYQINKELLEDKISLWEAEMAMYAEGSDEQIAYARKIAEAKETIRQNEILKTEEDAERIKKAEAEKKKAIQDSFDAINNAAKAVGNLLQTVSSTMQGNLELQLENGDITRKQAERQFEDVKKLQIAETWISTLTGAMDAYKAMSSIPYIGPALGAAAATAVVAAGKLNVNKIKATKLGGNSNTEAVIPQTFDTAPTYTINSTGEDDTTRLENAIVSGLKSATIKAYVVESDVTSSQAKQKAREDSTTW